MKVRFFTCVAVRAGILLDGDCLGQVRKFVAPPSGLVGWSPGDGNAKDFAGTNNGGLHGGVSIVTGEVGQAFGCDGGRGIVNSQQS